MTGLRFVAAFTIALGHYYEPWLEVSGIGMPLFFTLSGFIIHYVYAASFAGDWRAATREFAVARFSRIYPLYFVLLAYYLVRTDMGRTLANIDNLPVLLAYLLGCWTWWPFTVKGQPLLDWHYHISWSISTEMFFYLAYAAVLYRIAAIRSLERCLLLLAAFCVAAYLMFYALFLTRDAWEAAGLALFPQFAPFSRNFGESFYRWLLYFSPYSRVFEFIGGCLTAQAFLLLRAGATRPGWCRPGLLAWIAIAVVLVLWAAFFHTGLRHPWLAAGNTSPAAFLVSLHMNFLLAPPCYVLIFALAVGGSAISRVLSTRLPRLLGDISYSTYLSHIQAERVLAHLRIEIAPVVPHLIAIFVAIYALSWVLYRVVELPAKRLLRQVLSPSRRAAPPAPLAPAKAPAQSAADG